MKRFLLLGIRALFLFMLFFAFNKMAIGQDIQKESVNQQSAVHSTDSKKSSSKKHKCCKRRNKADTNKETSHKNPSENDAKLDSIKNEKNKQKGLK